MLVLHCVLVVIAPVPWPYVYMQLVGPPQTPDFHNLPSDFTQQISLVIFSIFSLPIKQIVSRTSHSRLPGVLYWCCALFAVSHPIAVSLSPEKESLEGREQLYFSSGGGCPGFSSALFSTLQSYLCT